PEALEQINWIMRDWRRNQQTTMDPNTIDILWEMHTELGSKEPINIICGYRSRETNEMLRRTVGGQASE
ncbi:YcbK family protein, partial [Providencia rettgeri]|uniref:YcbK family protein n=1 Tax=Providencia rettgeri TaxID=587 RepID=UPI0023612069